MRTFTAGAMPIFALETAGGVNVAEDALASRNTNVAVYGKERILSKAGEIDVVVAESSQALLEGTTLDFVELEPDNWQFIFMNPNDKNYSPPA